MMVTICADGYSFLCLCEATVASQNLKQPTVGAGPSAAKPQPVLLIYPRVGALHERSFLVD